MIHKKEINEKLRILRDFCILNKRNYETIKTKLESAKTEIELDRLARELIDKKLHYVA